MQLNRMMQNRFPLTGLLVIVLCMFFPSLGRTQEILSVKKIWDAAPHNAFTDLVRYNDRWFCVFREGKGHVSPDGALRVLTSLDGEQWESAALLQSSVADLRDAKICVTPDGRLMLGGAGALHDQSQHRHQSLVWFSDDGFQWSEAFEVADPNYWLWRITWLDKIAYGVAYKTVEPRETRLYRSTNGTEFETIVGTLNSEGYPNESAIVFDKAQAICLLRRDGNPGSGLLGFAEPPYTQWEWKDLGVRIGGPHMIRLEDGRLLAAVRLYDGKVRTSLCWVDEAGSIEEFVTLPSGGDTSYAGMVVHEGILWVSYYSSHEDKTSIYMAKVKIPHHQD